MLIWKYIICITISWFLMKCYFFIRKPVLDNIVRILTFIIFCLLKTSSWNVKSTKQRIFDVYLFVLLTCIIEVKKWMRLPKTFVPWSLCEIQLFGEARQLKTTAAVAKLQFTFLVYFLHTCLATVFFQISTNWCSSILIGDFLFCN